jgi:hypothetical protein
MRVCRNRDPHPLAGVGAYTFEKESAHWWVTHDGFLSVAEEFGQPVYALRGLMD